MVVNPEMLQIVSAIGRRGGLKPERASVFAAGPVILLGETILGFFCSSRCPGAVILKTFDAIKAARNQGKVVIGGFHSPMEWESFGILLRGRQPLIWAPARSIHGMQLKPELEPAFKAQRLLIVSPFDKRHKRITAALAEERNRFVAALADHILVAHAAPGSRTLALCRELIEQGRVIHTIDDQTNANLLDLGAVAIKPEDEWMTS